MKTILIAVLLVESLSASTVTVCSSGCTTTSLQTALDSTAVCGDTIAIKSTEIQIGNFTITDRSCASNTPITVTTDRTAWLPLSGTRITPSHLLNMATISTANSSPALTSVLTAGVPAKHWIFKGIAFTSSYSGLTNNLILSKNYVAASDSEVPDDITFDRCYFYAPLPNGTTNVTNAIYGEISNWVVKNSFVGDIANPGQETHGFSILTTPGPVTFTNNFITTSSMPIFAGGAVTDYPVVPTNITAQYNYSWRPWKWNNDPDQPYYADYLANGSYHPCNKNHGEVKFGGSITWKYNGAENAWVADQCFSQYNGFTNTIRTNWFASFQNPVTMGTMSLSDTTHATWSGTTFTIESSQNNGLGPITDLSYGLCINFNSGVLCRPFTVFDNVTKTVTLSTAFPSAPAGNFNFWVVYNGNELVNSITIEKNIFKNVSRGVNALGLSPSNGVSNAGKLINSTFSNNMIWNYNPYMLTAFGVNIQSCFTGTAGEEGYQINAPLYILNHNTCYSAVGRLRTYYGFAETNNGTVNRQVLWDTFTGTNNLAGPSADYPLSGTGTSGNTDLTMSTYVTGGLLKNNGMPGIGSGACTGSNTCTGNITSDWVDPFANSSQGIFAINASHAYAKAGTDGLNLGADFSQLPFIKNIKVNGLLAEIQNTTPVIDTNKVALLEFDLSAPNQAAGSTQPCVLEVSSSQNLQNDLNTYNVINELNPTFFKQADSTTGANPLLPLPVVANAHVSWPIGLDGTVTGDDGLPHNLRLTAGTTYYGRIQCYGDSVQLAFTTAASANTATTFTVSQKVPVAYDTYRIEYGSSTSFGSHVDATPDGVTHRASATIPITPNSFVYWRPLYRASGVTYYTGPTRIKVN